jgi:hypothetical protein
VAGRKPAAAARSHQTAAGGASSEASAGGAGHGQTAPERPSDDPVVLREAAQETLRKSGEALRKVALPPGAEPAFVFKP